MTDKSILWPICIKLWDQNMEHATHYIVRHSAELPKGRPYTILATDVHEISNDGRSTSAVAVAMA